MYPASVTFVLTVKTLSWHRIKNIYSQAVSITQSRKLSSGAESTALK